MNKLKYVLVTTISFVITVFNVNAATCNYEEQAKLNSEVANIKTNYEVKQRVLDKSEYDVPDAILGTEYEDEYEAVVDYMQINILNLTENVYVEVTNNYNKTVKTYRYSDADKGNVSFKRSGIDSLTTYTFKIYASKETGCEGTLLKTLYLSLPRYNNLSEYAVCSDIPDYYLCQKYVNFDEVSFSDFIEETTKEIEKNKKDEQEEQNTKWYQKIGDFIVKNKMAFIIGGVIVIGAAGTVTFVIIRKRRRSIV